MTDTQPAAPVAAAESESPRQNADPRALALALFDATAAAHRLPAKARRLAGLAADAYEAARRSGAAPFDRAARDALLAAPVDGLSAADQATAAAAASLLRAKPRPHREAALLALREQERERALRLAALVRLALALEAVETRQVSASAEATRIVLDGADARTRELLEERADLWRRAIGPLAVHVAGDHDGLDADILWPAVVDTAPEAGPLRVTPGALRGDEPAAEGARRVLRRFFERMLAREDDVRKGEEPEDVHQMRVATRRLRASLQVVEPLFDPQLVREYRRGLRRVARALGDVRDKDVFLGSILEYRETLPEERRGSLDRLTAAVRDERTPARARLEADLEAGRYARFKRSFAAFLTTPGAGVAEATETGVPARVRDVAGSAIWRRYEELRAFEAVLPDAPDEVLHTARIVGKRLRYTLEFFEDALGPRAAEVLGPLATLQETLGALQDAVVARAHVDELGLADDPGAQAYLAALAGSQARHIDELPRVWEKVASATYRRRLFELIVKL
jgi:CHAD domain-containing protein